MKNNKIFLYLIGFYFIVSGIFHFVRLALEWDIIIGDYYLRPWASAVGIIFASLVIYQVYRIRKSSQNEVKVEVVEEGESKAE